MAATVHVSFDVTDLDGRREVSPVRLAVRDSNRQIEEVRYTDLFSLADALIRDDRVPPTIVGSPRLGSVIAVIGGSRLRVARLSRPPVAEITDQSGHTRRVQPRWWLWMLTLKASRGAWALGTDRDAVRALELRRVRGQSSTTFATRFWTRAPTIGNIYHTGGVCWGDVWPMVARVPMRSPWCAVLDEIERLYWGSGFSRDLVHERDWQGPRPLSAILEDD